MSLKPEIAAALHKAFDTFDKKKSGHISIYSADSVLRMAGFALSDADYGLFLKRLDPEDGDTLEFDSLCRVVKELDLNLTVDRFDIRDDSEALREAFFVLSSESQGKFVSREALKRAMLCLGEKLTDEEVEDMIAEADQDHDGQISFREFVAMMNVLDE